MPASSSGSSWLLLEPKQRRQSNWVFIVFGKTLKYPGDFQYIQYTLLYRTSGSKFCRQMSGLAGHSVRQTNRVNHIKLEYFHETEVEDYSTLKEIYMVIRKILQLNTFYVSEIFKQCCVIVIFA
jgi:hypothetical protein